MPDEKAPEKCYPSTRYHPTHGARRVESAEHEADVAHPEKGWHETPANFPANTADESKCATCGQTLPGFEDDADDDSDPEAPAKPKRDRKKKPTEPKAE